MHVCKRCGKCCQSPATNKNTWTGGKLTWEQKQQLLIERKKYPPNEKGCDMLIFEGEIASCLPHKLFGIEAKDSACTKYPDGEKCLREKEL